MSASDNLKFEYSSDNQILVASILQSKMDKDQAKIIYEEVERSIKEYSDYKDFILDTGRVSDVTIASFGYLMKAFTLVNKTAGYMVIVIREEILQNFMLSNPEMFDFLAVFFTVDEAVKFIESKR
jgi:hypothetical protein